MGILDNEVGTRNEIRKKIAQITERDPQTLARTSDLSRELNFAEALPIFERTIDLFKQVDALLDTKTLSLNALAVINNNIDRTLQGFRPFLDFSLTQNTNRNFMADRAQLMQNAVQNYSEIFEKISPIIAYCGTRDTQLDESKVQANDVLVEMKQRLADLESIKQEANATLDIVKKMAEEAGVSQHAGIFADEARSHRISSRWWLGFTISLSIFTSGIAYHFFQLALDPSKTYSGSQAVQMAVAKIALLSILFTATIWVGRFYRSHRHNAVVNQHRSNALRTFEAFVKASKDDSTKNAVLIKATECIFSPQQTGYTSSEPETGGVAQVVEIVRGMTGKSA